MLFWQKDSFHTRQPIYKYTQIQAHICYKHCDLSQCPEHCCSGYVTIKPLATSLLVTVVNKRENDKGRAKRDGQEKQNRVEEGETDMLSWGVMKK